MKILFVLEKPFIQKCFKEVLDTMDIIDAIDFVSISPVFHIDDAALRFHIGENGLIYHGRKCIEEATWLHLNAIDIPDETFFVVVNKQIVDVNTYDLIVGCFNTSINNIMAFQKFLEEHDITNAKCISIYDTTISSIQSALQMKNIIDFKYIWFDAYNRLERNGFVPDTPREVDVARLRKKLGWTRREMSNFFEIPYRTLENWEHFDNLCPKYLFELMIYKLKHEGLFIE